MSNSVYRKLLNLDIFHNSLALHLYSKISKGFEVVKKLNYWDLKKIGMGYQEKFVYTDNRGRN